VLKQITIKRFKSIRDLDLEFGRINLFIGGNGAGKSNVLEAIGVVAAALSRGLTESDLSRKGVRLSPPALMKSAFKNVDLPKSLDISVAFQNSIAYSCSLTASESETLLSFRHEKCSLDNAVFFGRGPNGSRALGQSVKSKLDKHRGIWDQTKPAFDFPSDMSNSLQLISEYAIYSPQTEFLRGIKIGQIDSPPVGLHGEGLPSAVRVLLRQLPRNRLQTNLEPGQDVDARISKLAIDLAFLPGWARSVRVGFIHPNLRSREVTSSSEDNVFFIDKFMHQKRNTLSVYDSSEGTLFLLFAAILLAHRESPKIFALDNVDSALNPQLTKRLLETIISIVNQRQRDGSTVGPDQVFMTSHNPTALDAFDLFDESQRVFVVRRSEDGQTDVVRLAPRPGMSREDYLAARNGKSLSKMWIDGDISGALGNLF
jgi:predicted ATPase